jgi:hypothetical protein
MLFCLLSLCLLIFKHLLREKWFILFSHGGFKDCTNDVAAQPECAGDDSLGTARMMSLLQPECAGDDSL